MTGTTSYLIPTNEEEKKRLLLQHSIIIRQFGYHLHPQITVKPGDEVLDMGTGTGIWAIELAQKFPSTISVHACDINDKYFPSLEDTPPNVHFSVQSVLSLPQEWTNKFDICHQRLLICGLTAEQWRLALQELYRVTKPGGWIQLIEIDFRPSPIGAVHDKMADWLKTLCKAAGLIFDTVDQVSGHIKAAGFVDSLEEKMVFVSSGGNVDNALKGDLKADIVLCCVSFLRNMMPRVVALGLTTEEEYEQGVVEISREWQNAPDGLGQTWHVYCARKPL